MSADFPLRTFRFRQGRVGWVATARQPLHLPDVFLSTEPPECAAMLAWLQRHGLGSVYIDSRTRQSTPESGTRAGYDAAKRRRGSQVPTAVDSMGSLVAAEITAAHTQDRIRVGSLARQVQDVTVEAVEVAFVEQGYTGAGAAQAAQDQHRRLEVVKRPEDAHGFVLLPTRWVVERSNA